MKKGQIIYTLLLESRLGNRESFNKLRLKLKFVINEIYLAYLDYFPFLENKKIEIDQNVFLWLWGSVNDYDFSEEGFLYPFQEKLIFNFRQYLLVECMVPEKKIPSSDQIKSKLGRKNTSKNRKVYYGLKNLTTKQLQVVYWNCYKRKPMYMIAKIVGISEDSVKERLDLAFRKMKKVIYGEQTNSEKIRFREKSYKLPD